METQTIIIMILTIIIFVLIYLYITKKAPPAPKCPECEKCPVCPTCPVPQKDPELDYAITTMRAFDEILYNARINFICNPKNPQVAVSKENIEKLENLGRDPNFVEFAKKYGLHN